METFVILDLETTGLDPTADQIIEIAALKVAYDGGQYREIGRFQTLVALEAGRALPPFIAEYTGITARMLEGALDERCALEALTWFIANSTIVAHNAPFDLSFVHRLYCGEHLDYYEADRFICTRAMAKLLGYEKASLKDIYFDICGGHIDGHHRAMNDVNAVYAILPTLMDVCESAGIDYRNVVVDSPDRPLRFVPRGAKVVRMGYEEGAARWSVVEYVPREAPVPRD